MSNHVHEWLNAHLDGELKGRQLQQVEEHLAECEACRMELDSLARLSDVLHEVPMPEFASPERFAAQVSLLLPHRPGPTPKRNLFEIGWWMIPVGIVAVWVFIGTAILISDAVTAAEAIGLLDNTTAAWISSPSETAEWTSALGQFGMLADNSLQWAGTTESFARHALPQIVLQVSVAMLYLSWFATWWARQTRPGQGRLLEG